MLNRIHEIEKIKQLMGIFPVTAILGARQVGKTTIAKQMDADYYFDLENQSTC